MQVNRLRMAGELMERLAYSIQEFADALGVSRDLVNDMLKLGQVKSLKAGNRRLIPAAAVKEYLDTASNQVDP